MGASKEWDVHAFVRGIDLAYRIRGSGSGSISYLLGA